MNNGGGESSKECAQQNVQRTSGPDGFSHALAKTAVAQICESEGFQSFQISALDTLADVAIRYIINIGKIAHFHADLAGRTECNVFDVIQGLEDLGSPQGFLGASDVDHCLASSGPLAEIMQYVGEVGKLPFVYDVPRFPILKDRKPTPSFLALGQEPPDEHIPSWLPAFSDDQTYMQPPVSSERATDLPMENSELARQHRKSERLLLNLQQRVSCNGSKRLSSASLDAAKAKRAAGSNPFFIAPLPFGEKEVSPVVFPAKLLNEATQAKGSSESQGVDCPVSLLETFSPASDAVKRNSYNHDGKKALLSQRPAVQFKIGTSKKNLRAAFAGSPLNRGVEDVSPWFSKDIEMGEKITGEEELLKSSMDNPEELLKSSMDNPEELLKSSMDNPEELLKSSMDNPEELTQL